MARGGDDKRIEDVERRAGIHERELIVLAETIKELATQVHQLAQSQVQVIDSHDDLLKKISAMDRKLNDLTGED